MVVYLESARKEQLDMEPPVLTGLIDRSLGRHIPRFIVTDPASMETWAQAPFEKFTGSRAPATFSTVKKSVSTKLAAWQSSGKKYQLPKKDLAWPVGGASYHRGRFQKIEDGHLLLAGKKKLPLSGFTPATQRYAKQLERLRLHLEREKLIAEKLPPFKPETWKSTDGKPLIAKFVRLKGDELTLKNNDGKTFVFSITRLDEAGQARAKEHAKAVARVLEGL